jgi:hypothetical protein
LKRALEPQRLHSAPDLPQGATTTFTVKRLKQIAEVIAPQRYLEVGVHAGRTFHALDFPEMDAVDPNFIFDKADHVRDGRRYFEMVSDAFFANPPDARPYDLIFLDGLHTFEQTFRDFCATQALAHAGTVWLIDDTAPVDIFSAIPDQDLALELRAAHGLAGPGWNGDVFKTVFALHDFFPNIDFRTIKGQGRPQTMVIRHPRLGFAPRWNNLESISRMSYPDFIRNRDVMQESSMADALVWLKTARAGAATPV